MHDFDLLRILGSGTFGTVYKAKRMSDESIFALKYMHNRIMTEEDLKHALHVEVRALDLLSFSNFFPKLVCMNKDESIRELFYVMELVDGVALDQYVMQNRPTFKQVKLIFAKTLLALEDLRRVGLVHNDLKSDNIMISKNSIVKVIDFSLSSHFRDGYLNDSLFGKAASNGVWTPAIDYFYLGIAFYQLHAYMTIPFFYSSDIANELYFPFKTKNDQFVELKTPHVYFHWDFFNVLKPLLEIDWIKRVGRDYHSVLRYRFNTPYFKDVDWNAMSLNDEFDVEVTSEDLVSIQVSKMCDYMNIDQAKEISSSCLNYKNHLLSNDHVIQTLTKTGLQLELAAHASEIDKLERINREVFQLLELLKIDYARYSTYAIRIHNLLITSKMIIMEAEEHLSKAHNCVYYERYYEELLKILDFHSKRVEAVTIHNNEVFKRLKLKANKMR